MSKYSITSSRDKTEAILRVGGAKLTLNAVQLDQLIADLAQQREDLRPVQPLAAPASPVSNYVLDPLYYTALLDGTDQSLFMVRHPGFGWLKFAFPAVERRRIVEYFNVHEEALKRPRREFKPSGTVVPFLRRPGSPGCE